MTAFSTLLMAPTEYTNEEVYGDPPRDAVILLVECERLRSEGDAERALGLLDAAQIEDCADLLALRAALLGDLGRLEESLAVLRHARCVDATHHAARFGLCFTLYLLERWPEALSELEAFVADAPDQADALWLRAGLLRRLYDDSDARVLDAYDAVLRADASNLYARLERADVLRALGRYEEARSVYADFADADICPDETLRVEAAFKAGCVALVLNDTPAARVSFQSVIDAAPDYPDARDMLALVSLQPAS